MSECENCGYINGSGKLAEYRKLLQDAAIPEGYVLVELQGEQPYPIAMLRDPPDEQMVMVNRGDLSAMLSCVGGTAYKQQSWHRLNEALIP